AIDHPRDDEHHASRTGAQHPRSLHPLLRVQRGRRPDYSRNDPTRKRLYQALLRRTVARSRDHGGGVMRLVSATIYALHIPFTEAFKHSAKERTFCDSVIVRVQDEAGTAGFGEGVPRPYVTGETADTMIEHLARDLWPAVVDRELPVLGGEADLEALDACIPQKEIPGVLSDNASRAALELALLDCTLHRYNLSAAQILRPRRQKVIYSGVIT